MKRVLLLVCLALPACWLDEDLKQRRTTVPEVLDDGWEIASPQSAGLAPERLAAMHDEILREDRFVAMTALLIIKDGKLVWETYLRDPADRDVPHHVQSITKSVTSLAVGAAIARGEISGVDASIADLFPVEGAELEPRKQAMTLDDILTMRSGLDIDNDHFSIELWVDKPRDPLRYLLGKPLYADPGERFFYRDADPQLAGYALTRATSRSERDLVQERLFDPLGIHDIEWEAGHDGVTHAAHSLRIRPRDLAKVGQLVLQRGTWQGRELVPAQWIDEATRTHVDSSEEGPDGEPIGYGYYFWVVPGLGFTMAGHGGQYVFIVPEEQLVMVAIGYPDSELHGSALDEFVPLVTALLGRP